MTEKGNMPRKKTSIYVDEDVWRDFTIFVVTKYGNQKLSETLEEAISFYMEKHPI